MVQKSRPRRVYSESSLTRNVIISTLKLYLVPAILEHFLVGRCKRHFCGGPRGKVFEM